MHAVNMNALNTLATAGDYTSATQGAYVARDGAPVPAVVDTRSYMRCLDDMLATMPETDPADERSLAARYVAQAAHDAATHINPRTSQPYKAYTLGQIRGHVKYRKEHTSDGQYARFPKHARSI